MSTWLTEKEYVRSGGYEHGITINVAFLKEIKEETTPVRDQISKINTDIQLGACSPRESAERLQDLRDGLETYFALEECYGYFQLSKADNSQVSNLANHLKSEHVSMFVRLNEIVDLAEQIVYRECDSSESVRVAELFNQFAIQFEEHEQLEMELMMRLCNEEFGVGD